jgi:uncharacterized protein (TIGR00304 family)
MPQYKLISIGIFLIIIGFLIVFIGSLLSSGAKAKGETKVAVIGLLGPIPFGFGNDKKLFLIALVIGVCLFLFSLFYYLRLAGKP